jgi:hypothetical protein
MTEDTGIGWRGWLTRALLLVLLASLIGPAVFALPAFPRTDD